MYVFVCVCGMCVVCMYVCMYIYRYITSQISLLSMPNCSGFTELVFPYHLLEINSVKLILKLSSPFKMKPKQNKKQYSRKYSS